MKTTTTTDGKKVIKYVEEVKKALENITDSVYDEAWALTLVRLEEAAIALKKADSLTEEISRATPEGKDWEIWKEFLYGEEEEDD